MSSSPLSEAPDNGAAATGKRRSGRVTRKPSQYTEPSTKRKRAADDDRDDDDDDDAQDDDDDDSEPESEPDEEELREQRARARKTKAAAPKKPAAKRTKTNGVSVALPVRALGGKKGRPKKAKAVDEAAAEEAGGLYADVFARDQTLDEAASQWIESFGEHESRAVAALVTFVLKCAGCDLHVTKEDIEDPDNCTNRLGDLQDEFQEQKLSEYPIIAKGKGTAAFKDAVTGFFHTLIRAVYTSNLLFANIELIENIQVWLTTMSAAQNRPFRHTATVVSLSVITALCEIGSELAEEASKALRHSETQRKGKNANKSRVSELQKESKAAKHNQELLDTLVKDWFDTIYIHRYRDVDPHIRVDCARALGDWIVAYPDVFFDGSHLRYLGWVLSDPNHSTRLEVIKQLHRFYADTEKLGGLKTFTERFRSRMVEMASRDAEASVRAAAVELLDLLREGGLLEPDDIDAIGRLIFDAEPKVRKSVVGFFAESINDAYEAKVDSLGGQEALEEILGDGTDSFDSPSQEWIKLKCLAEGLDSYDSADAALPPNVERGPGQDTFHLHAGSAESRFMVAADTIYDHVPEVREWEMLAGYLLYDTSAEDQNGEADGGDALLKKELRLTENEEVILLEVLNSSVKQTVASLVDSNPDKRAKRTKRQREELGDMQEQAARHLANLIPRLLKKFGESPQTAATILRLERVLNLDAFQEFRQESTLYAALLDDINKQFLTHSNEEVLAEASRALLRAKSYHELGDTTDEKIESLWEDTINTFSALTRGKTLASRGSLSATVLDAVSKTVLRLEKLSSISNPIEYLETAPTPSTSRKSQSLESVPPIDSLTSLVNRAATTSSKKQDAQTAALEDSLAMHASRTVCFYFMWRIPAFIKSLQTVAIAEEELESLATRRDAYINSLGAVLKSHALTDDISLAVSGMLLDIHTITATLRQVSTDKNGDEFLALALEMDAALQKRILRVFGAAETAFAKASGRHLETGVEDTQDADSDEGEPADPVDDDPVSDNDDSEPEGEDGEDEQATQASQVRRAKKLQNSLLAEQRLCELAGKLVLAILGRMVNAAAVKARLERNKTRLGHNFKLVLEHLDTNDRNKSGKRAKAVPRTAAQQQQQQKQAKEAAAKSKEMVEEDESDEEDEEERREREIREDEETQEAEEAAEEANHEHNDADDVESVIGD